MSLFDDNENEENECEEDYVWEDFHFHWKGKDYHSIETFRKDLSTEDLKALLKTSDEKIAQDNKKLARANLKHSSFGMLTFLGISMLVVNILFPSIIKNVVSIFSLASVV